MSVASKLTGKGVPEVTLGSVSAVKAISHLAAPVRYPVGPVAVKKHRWYGEPKRIDPLVNRIGLPGGFSVWGWKWHDRAAQSHPLNKRACLAQYDLKLGLQNIPCPRDLAKILYMIFVDEGHTEAIC